MPKISNKIFLPFLLNEQGLCWVWNSTRRRPELQRYAPLKHQPVEWQDTEITWVRSASYYGIDRNFTTSYTFVKDGEKILNWLFHNGRGIEERVFFMELKFNPATRIYEFYYKAEIDLSKINPSRSGFQVNLVDYGTAKYIKANENTVYTIPCNSTVGDAIQVYFDGFPLFDKFNYKTLAVNVETDGFDYTSPVTFINNEGDNVGIEKGGQSVQKIPDFGDFLDNSSNYLFKTVNAPISLHVTATQLQITIVPNNTLAPQQVVWYFTTSSHVNYEIVNYIFTAAEHTPRTFTVDIDFIIPLAMGERLFLLSYSTNGEAEFQYTDSLFSIEFQSQNPPSTAWGLRPDYVHKKLIELMTGGNFQAESSLLAGEANDFVLMSGDNIRGFDDPNTGIQISYSDFFKIYADRFGGAATVRFNDQMALFEKKEFVFDNNRIMTDLGELANWSYEISDDYLYSRIKVGYQDQQYEQRNGRFEVNSEQYYNTPITRVNKELDLFLPVRSDPYGIEFIRQDFFNKQSTDSKGDKENFIINIGTEQIDGAYILNRPAYSPFTGVATDRIFNVELSPKRILNANLPLLQGSLYNLPSDRISFLSGKKNVDMVAGTVSERAGIRIDTMPNSWYRYIIIQGETEVPGNVVNLLSVANTGVFTFTINGYRMYGFPMEVSTKPATQEKQVWKLLCSSLTDMSIFVKLKDDVLNLNGMGIFSHCMPDKIYKNDEVLPSQYHFIHMDKDWFKNRISRYSVRKDYPQKYQTNDSIPLQFITESAMVHVDLIDCNQRVWRSLDLDQITDPAVINPSTLWQGELLLNDIPRGTYWLKYTIGVGESAQVWISEPKAIAADWPDTLRFDYTNDENTQDVLWSLYDGNIRVEGFIQEFNPTADKQEFVDDRRNAHMIFGTPGRSWQLFIGAEDGGVPDWMIDKINRILLLESVFIDGVQYTIAPDSQLEQLFKTDGVPTGFWAITIWETNNEGGIFIGGGGIPDSPLTVQYNIATMGFTSIFTPVANQQNTVTQITRIE